MLCWLKIPWDFIILSSCNYFEQKVGNMTYGGAEGAKGMCNISNYMFIAKLLTDLLHVELEPLCPEPLIPPALFLLFTFSMLAL